MTEEELQNKADYREESSMDNWYPRLENIDVPIPFTVKIEGYKETLYEGSRDEMEAFVPDVEELREAVREVGGTPAFLRTDQMSDKHNVSEGSRIDRIDDVHLNSTYVNLIEKNKMVGAMGVPYKNFYVREWIDFEHRFEGFNGLPISQEVRYFIDDGEIHDYGWYWEEEALERTMKGEDEGWRDELQKLKEDAIDACEGEHSFPRSVVQEVAYEFDDGYWSVDLAKSQDDVWYVIDMARGEVSWHPESVENIEDL